MLNVIIFLRLLEKERSLNGIPFGIDIGWSKFDPKDKILGKDIFGKSAIFPFHNILTLAADDSPERLEQLHNLIQNNKLLHQTAKTYVILLFI